MRCFPWVFLLAIGLSSAQAVREYPLDTLYIKELVVKFKDDPRGPYRDIRWFCDDGTLNLPKEPCESGGVQHARYKQEVIELGEKGHIFLGQILASTDYATFWDAENDQSRLKQYLIEAYLKGVDDGWINRKAQYYRGAIQAEDEDLWGQKFLSWLLKDDDVVNAHFYLVRQAARNIPHAGDGNIAQQMRSESKAIADAFPAFMDLRIKIHGQPEATDIEKVKSFMRSHDAQLNGELRKQFSTLLNTMGQYFKPVDLTAFRSLASDLTNPDVKTHILEIMDANEGASAKVRIESATELMGYIRDHILDEASGQGRLAMMDLSIQLEALIMRTIDLYPQSSLSTLLDKVCYLSAASAATGYTELWEWNELRSALAMTPVDALKLGQLEALLVAARNQLEWGTGKNNAVFGHDVARFGLFEPKALGFLDDRIRGSVALYLGNTIGALGQFISTRSGLQNQVFDLPNQSHIHGLNPGYANGKLVVVEGPAENMEVDPSNIYVFARPPSDLKPVAGILNISEGNLVSHLQLLARNLGIPNASISADNLDRLKRYSGSEVFYAVSNKGTVILKPESAMSPEEHDLFTVAARQESMITVPTDKLKLDQTTVLDLKDVDASFSGIQCGPKAANLGQLKKNFPDHVVEGFVIPFGIFLDHMNQTIPGQHETYWGYLMRVFDQAKRMGESGRPAREVEAYQLGELAKLRTLIATMPLKDSFIQDLSQAFRNILKVPIGQQGVFLRSDTNMEDLKNFTGAGLNLTLFNVVDKDKILEGIKKVWASPYTERSFKWRQRLLNNPENVYPSILVIPGVNNDCSGVMITKGVDSGRTDEITVAFSRGVGGAVDGQAAETWAIPHSGTPRLLAPSREPEYKALPPTGGTVTKLTTFEKAILSRDKLVQLNGFRKVLEEKMGSEGIVGPYDVELGFKDDKIWLFQVRPYVENKNALSSTYLESISPHVDTDAKIPLRTQL